MTRSPAAPPRLARRLVRVAVRETDWTGVDDSLRELFARHAERSGVRTARRWYWRQAIGFLVRWPTVRERSNPEARSRAGGWTQDLKFAARALVRQPGFTTLAVSTLAVGIAANVTVFSALDGALFRALPIPAADRLMAVRVAEGTRAMFPQYGTVARWRDVTLSHADVVFAYHSRWQDIDGLATDDDELIVQESSLGFFESVAPVVSRGRPIDARDYAPDAEPVLVISDEFWRRPMAADPDVLGRLLRVNGVPHRVVGVLAPGFRFESRVERAYSALPEAGPGSPAPDDFIATFVRLREGSTPEQLAAELGALLAADAGAAPASRVTFEPLRDRLYGWAADRFSPYMGVVAFVLLLVAANLATLVLVRSIRRRRELAVRAALGADRWRLARLLVAEVALVVAAATAFGALLASWGIAAMVRLDLMGVAGTAPRLDARAIGFAMLVGLGAGVLAAVVPVAGLARADLSDALRQSSGRTTGTRRQRTAQRALVVVQIACSLLLLVGAGLLTKTMVRMHRYDPGFETQHLLSMYTSVPEGRYTSEAERRLVIDQTIERIDAVPGVEVAAAVVGGGSSTRGSATRDAGITLEGESAALTPADYGERGSWSYVTAGYFRALGVTMRAGRPFTAADASPSAPPAAIVNEEAARRWWPDSPTVVGRRLKFGGPDSAAPWLTVAGVAPTYGTAVAETMAWEPSPRVFLPLGHDPVPDWPSYYVRTTSSPMALLPAVRAAIDRVDPDILIRNPYDMEGQLAYEVSRYQVSVNVLMACAAFGALLAAMGLYGVVAHGVAARTREIGIRKALGATRRDVLRAVAGEGLVVTVVGLLAGLALSMALSRSLEAMLFGVDPLDPWVFASAAAGFTVIVAVATWLPARRATRVEPTIALRVE